MSDNAPITQWAFPLVLIQALEDTQLRPLNRVAMWYLIKRLSFFEFREVKVVSLASEMDIHENTAEYALKQLVERGYLEEHHKRKPRAFRLPQSRRTSEARAA